jgi:predicted lipoprotein with Yx(FWY)xxD motif
MRRSLIARHAQVAVKTVIVITAAAVVLGGSLAGCGTSGRATTSPDAASVPSRQADHPASTRRADPARRANPGPVAVQVMPTPYGRALTDGRGFALYRFTHDHLGSSTCYGACAVAWPPYLVKERPSAAGPGAHSRQLGAVRRTDGRLQLTYAGHPLYYYVGDRHPREVLCQSVTEFGGSWYVVAPDGRAIT